jgi:hypothetical protein
MHTLPGAAPHRPLHTSPTRPHPPLNLSGTPASALNFWTAAIVLESLAWLGLTGWTGYLAFRMFTADKK